MKAMRKVSTSSWIERRGAIEEVCRLSYKSNAKDAEISRRTDPSKDVEFFVESSLLVRITTSIKKKKKKTLTLFFFPPLEKTKKMS